MDDRELVLGALPAARGGDAPAPKVRVKTVPSADLWPRFVAMVEFHKGEMGDLKDLSAFHGQAFWDHDMPESVVRLLGPRIESVWEAECGVTLCDAAIAETGSLIVSAGPGRHRLASLAPPVHIALVPPGSLVAGLEEGMARLSGPTSVVITGPSRTADVEGVIVMGVHGPKRLIVVPLPA